MKIYVAHTRNSDFETELYEPLRTSALAHEHTFVFPHAEGDTPFNSKQFFQEGCDMVVAEVSLPATGLGIELGWANMLGIPIVCIHKSDAKVSGSLSYITNNFIVYEDTLDMLAKIEEWLNTYSRTTFSPTS